MEKWPLHLPPLQLSLPLTPLNRVLFHLYLLFPVLCNEDTQRPPSYRFPVSHCFGSLSEPPESELRQASHLLRDYPCLAPHGQKTRPKLETGNQEHLPSSPQLHPKTSSCHETDLHASQLPASVPSPTLFPNFQYFLSFLSKVLVILECQVHASSFLGMCRTLCSPVVNFTSPKVCSAASFKPQHCTAGRPTKEFA